MDLSLAALRIESRAGQLLGRAQVPNELPTQGQGNLQEVTVRQRLAWANSSSCSPNWGGKTTPSPPQQPPGVGPVADAVVIAGTLAFDLPLLSSGFLPGPGLTTGGLHLLGPTLAPDPLTAFIHYSGS